MPGGKLSPSKLTRAMRRMEAWKMRLAGHTYAEIAEHLREKSLAPPAYSSYSVLRDLEEVMTQYRERHNRQAEEYFHIHLQRYESLFKAHYALATGADGSEPDARSAMVCCKILQQQAKMLGIEEPNEVHQIEQAVAQAYGQSTAEQLEASAREILSAIASARVLAIEGGD